MKPRTLALDASLDELQKELLHTLALLHAYPFLASQAAEFEQLVARWQALGVRETELLKGHLEAQARVIVVDDDLDRLCTGIAATVVAECNNDRKAPMYQRYFGSTTPSKLRRPVLGRQLDTMRTWPPSLQAPENSEVLRAYGAQLAALIPEADAAAAALSEARRKNADHEIGARKDYVASVNAARIELYGRLSAMALEQPERKLSRDFARRFFKRSRGRSRRPQTVVEVERILADLQQETERYQALRAQIIVAEEASRLAAKNAALRAAEEALQAAEAAQAEADQAAADAAARVQVLRDELTEEEAAGGETAVTGQREESED